MKPERTINQKMVEAALIMKQINGEMIQTVPDNVDLKHVYCANFTNSVIDGITADMFCCDLIRGDGRELSNQSGSAPKFNSIVSSASMAVSTFAPWKNRLSELSIDLGSQQLTGFNKLEFEHIARTAIPRAKKHPNLDVWLESDNAILAIECKFCEFLSKRDKKASLNPSYKRLATEQKMDSPWVKAIDVVTNKNGISKYQFFDAVQIIRHYFGVLNSGQKEKHLLYLYWHPENKDWMNIHPYGTHLMELREFSELVSKATDVQFHYMSINELWEQWYLSSNSQVKDHLKEIKKKYSIKINNQSPKKKELQMLKESDNIRTKDFKLFDDDHGKTPKNPLDERSMSRHLYWGKKPLKVNHLSKQLRIDLIGYEVPLGTNKKDQQFIDLVGLDKSHVLYLIEIKNISSSKRPSDVVKNQINIYHERLKKSLPYLVAELNQNERYRDVKIDKITKILLAPLKYYQKYESNIVLVDDDVLFCYFAKSIEYSDIASVSDDDSIQLCTYTPDSLHNKGKSDASLLIIS